VVLSNILVVGREEREVISDLSVEAASISKLVSLAELMEWERDRESELSSSEVVLAVSSGAS
jgi:hypothetical protein